MPRWDALRFLTEYKVPYWTQGEHCSIGWINIQCPLCDDPTWHGGINPEAGYYHCWHCGGHPLTSVIRKLLSIKTEEAKRIHREYLGRNSYALRGGDAKRREATATSIELPGASPLGKYHRRYLDRRDFDPDLLQTKYSLRGTGPGETFKGMDYSLRVIIPIYDFTERLVSFQGRAISKDEELRYKGCPVEHSLIHYKDSLYNIHLARNRKRVVVVEGVFDAWRMGDGFIASFGTSMTPLQIKELARWDEIFFLFDDEGPAQASARKYGSQLSSLGKSVEIIRLSGMGGKDPGDLPEEEARAIRRELGIP